MKKKGLWTSVIPPIPAFLRKRPRKGATFDELVQIYGVSSLRRTLQNLENQGLVKRVVGTGGELFFFRREKERMVWEVMES